MFVVAKREHEQSEQNIKYYFAGYILLILRQLVFLLPTLEDK